MSRGIIRLLPQRGVFPNSTLNGIDPSQVGSKVFWFKPLTTYLTLNSQTISQWNDAFALGHNVIQATAARQPLYLPFTGPVGGGNGNYVYFPGNNNGEYVSTPDSVALSITDELDMRCLCQPDNWATVTGQTLCSKWTTTIGGRSWLWIIANGLMTLSLSFNGATIISIACTAPVTYTGSNTGALRVYFNSNDGGVYTAKFYDSPDGGSTWTQLGATITGGSIITIFDSPTQVEVGSYDSGITACFKGKIYNLNIRAAFNGSLRASFNPDKGNAYQLTFTPNTGEVWTITNVTSTGGYHMQLVDQAMVQFDGVDDRLTAVPFSFNQPATIYLMCKQMSFTSTDYFVDGNGTNTMGITQQGTTPDIKQSAGVFSSANNGFAINTFRIITAVFDGVNSLLQIDNGGVSVIGNAGSNNPGGIMLGGRGDGSRFGNFTVLEYLGYNAAHSEALQISIRNGMASRHHYTML